MSINNNSTSLQVGTYGDGFVQLLDSEYANRSEEDRINWVTQLAAISRGKKESANPALRYKSLLQEAEGDRPSRPLEFLPIELSKDDCFYLCGGGLEKTNNVLRFSYIDNNSGRVYTNMRSLLWAGVRYEDIPYLNKTSSFAAFRVRAPMFVWAQIVTHTQLSTESQSDRVAESDHYWLPCDIEDRMAAINEDDRLMDQLIGKVFPISEELADLLSDGKVPTRYNDFIEAMVNIFSQRDVQLLLKSVGYPREIWSRAPYYFKMKEFVITGWTNDDFAWPHFLRERNAYADDGGPKNWTQPETEKYAKAIRKLLEDNNFITKQEVLRGDS